MGRFSRVLLPRAAGRPEGRREAHGSAGSVVRAGWLSTRFPSVSQLQLGYSSFSTRATLHFNVRVPPRVPCVVRVTPSALATAAPPSARATRLAAKRRKKLMQGEEYETKRPGRRELRPRSGILSRLVVFTGLTTFDSFNSLAS